MPQTTWPSVAGGRTVTDLQWETIARGFAADGIFGSPDDPTIIFGDSTGRQVKIRANRSGLVGGHGWSSDPSSDETVAIAANSSGLTRTDYVVLRLTRSTWSVAVAVVQGNPGSGAPSINRSTASNGLWDMPLALVTVANGATTISAANVTWTGTWIGPASIVQVNDASLVGYIPDPQPGSLAWVAGTVNKLYCYIWATGWTRADWHLPFGVLAGSRWTTLTTLGAGIPSSEFASNMDTGTVSVYAGRRYRIVAKIRHLTGTADQRQIFRIREGSVSGTLRHESINHHQPAGSGNTTMLWSEYEEGLNRSVNFIVTAAVLSGGGTMDIIGPGTPQSETYVYLEDIGPAGLLTTRN